MLLDAQIERVVDGLLRTLASFEMCELPQEIGAPPEALLVHREEFRAQETGLFTPRLATMSQVEVGTLPGHPGRFAGFFESPPAR